MRGVLTFVIHYIYIYIYRERESKLLFIQIWLKLKKLSFFLFFFLSYWSNLSSFSFFFLKKNNLKKSFLFHDLIMFFSQAFFLGFFFCARIQIIEKLPKVLLPNAFNHIHWSSSRIFCGYYLYSLLEVYYWCGILVSLSIVEDVEYLNASFECYFIHAWLLILNTDSFKGFQAFSLLFFFMCYLMALLSEGWYIRW